MKLLDLGKWGRRRYGLYDCAVGTGRAHQMQREGIVSTELTRQSILQDGLLQVLREGMGKLSGYLVQGEVLAERSQMSKYSLTLWVQ